MNEKSDMPEYAIALGAEIERNAIAEAMHQAAVRRANEARLVELEERRSLEAAELLAIRRRDRDAAVATRRAQIRRVR